MRRFHFHMLPLLAALLLPSGCSRREHVEQPLQAAQRALLTKVYRVAGVERAVANECLLALLADPTDVEARMGLASSAVELGLEDWALETVAAAPFDPRYRELWARLARYAYAEHRAEFVTLSRQLLQYDPFDADAANGLAYYFAERNENLEEAEALARRALALAPEEGAVLDTVGWVYYRQGRYEKALEYLRRAISKPGMARIPEVAEHLAAAYQALGDEDAARRVRAQLPARQAHPGDPQGAEQ